ncbi:DinB family protein [Brevibacterium litoralis]|uniref:DinB family protein n=1 Tax=Brevibacterium litoralis TaxID=3138935 RepID=UPI0032EC1178
MTFDYTTLTDPPEQNDELRTLLSFLDLYRTILHRKADGLDAAGLRHTVGSSTMTLGGMLVHLAGVEDDWLGHVIAGRPDSEPWASAPWDEDNDWDWHVAVDMEPAAIMSLYRENVDRSRAIEAGLTPADLDRPTEDPDLPRRGHKSVRWILVHMIEEYARHAGHADLLREDIDGKVGD